MPKGWPLQWEKVLTTHGRQERQRHVPMESIMSRKCLKSICVLLLDFSWGKEGPLAFPLELSLKGNYHVVPPYYKLFMNCNCKASTLVEQIPGGIAGRKYRRSEGGRVMGLWACSPHT
jgi:hypothetical protein